MLKIVICDDEPRHLKNAHKLVLALLRDTAVRICGLSDPQELLSLLNTSYTPDIAILDVEMPGVDGITLARHINARCPDCRIIFLTGFQQYAPDVYLADHLWFVLKTSVEKYLPLALEKAVAELRGEGKERLSFTVRIQRTDRRVYVDEVLYLERVTYHTRIVTLQDSFFVTQAPAKLLAALPEGTFIHCHQSFWANSSKICSQIGNDFVLTNGSTVPISRAMKKAATEAFRQQNGN